jgi:hypothetical protein
MSGSDDEGGELAAAAIDEIQHTDVNGAAVRAYGGRPAPWPGRSVMTTFQHFCAPVAKQVPQPARPSACLLA